MTSFYERARMNPPFDVEELGDEDKGAWFDSTRRFRYLLWRRIPKEIGLPQKPADVLFIGLNPSTADERLDDSTIVRCRNFTRAWGYERYVMANIFAYRSRMPGIVISPGGIEVIGGPTNDGAILYAAVRAQVVICAWGKHHKGSVEQRATAVLKMLHEARIETRCLTTNRTDGSPAHPLYLRSSLFPIPYP